METDTNKQLVLNLYYLGTSESSSTTISTRFGSTAGSRFLSSRSNERIPTAINYSATDRLRNANTKSINQKDEEESRLAIMPDKDENHKTYKTSNRMEEDETDNRLSDNEFVTLTMVTRSTSPTPPASSSYVRNRRAEIGIVHQKEVIRSRKLPDTTNEETQCDRMEETSRFSRYGGNNRISGAPWSTYLDKYSSGTTSVGGPSMYSSRGFTNASSSSGRFNSFAYTRTNEPPATTRNESATKESSSSSQETHSSSNKNQNEKVSSGLKGTTSNENSTSSDSNTSSNAQNIHGTNKEINGRIRDSEQCSCGGRKPETSGNSESSRVFNQNVAFHRKDDSMEDSQESNGSREDWSSRQSSVSRCDEYNQRKPSIPRVGPNSTNVVQPKSEIKISKCSSKTEIISPKREAYCERRGSTPKSDASSSSKNSSKEESLRIVEGHCQNQNEEIISQKRDISQRKDSTSRYVNLLSNEIIIYIIYKQLYIRKANYLYYINYAFVKNIIASNLFLLI